jgi:aryl-alcohol dehydrogenase-like predicted oxidoreductase
MDYVTLGRTGLEVSRICFGAAPLDQRAAITAVQRALDLGVTLFAAADAPSERLLGRALGARRDDAVLATTRRAETLGDSLRNAGVDRVDLLVRDLPADRTADALEALERGGPVETVRTPYHPLRREAEEAVLPWCRERDVGVLATTPPEPEAIAWTLAQPGVHAAVVDVRRPADLEAAVLAVDLRLDDIALRRIDDQASAENR